MATPRLRRRILLVVSSLTLAASLIFSLYTLVFVYAVEDAFFNARLQQEAAYQEAEFVAQKRWSQPRDPRIHLHSTPASLPREIRNLLREEPRRTEFPGSGESHYHLRPVTGDDGAQAWLLYDVGAELVVSPMRDRLLWLLAGTMLVLVAAALCAGYWASWRTTLRLDRLAAAVAALDPARLPASWPQATLDDEVGIVASGLDAMTRRLREFVERERGFTRDASHELRTPLAVIRSASDQLMSQPELGASARRLAELIRESTANLAQTVDTLLALAREESDQDAASRVALLPLIERIIVEQSPRLEGKPAEVEVEVPASASLQAPQAVAAIVLANLIGNAFAHTATGIIRIDTRDGVLRIANPAGHALPESGVQSANDSSSVSESYGFGLGIVQRLCDRFGLVFSLRIGPDAVVASLVLAVES